MRALLLYNPSATTTTPAVTDIIARALASQLKLEVVATKRRNHAGFLAAGAADEDYELVVVLGGDGTANEVIQGIAKTRVKLAVIPGGSTNVLARSLGLPNDPIEATNVVLRKLAAGTERRVNLGLANERYFAFNAGFGFDAAVVRLVERRARLKRTVRQATFLWCGVLAYLGGYDRRRTNITVHVPGEEPTSGFRSVVCCNARPYTYLGPWPADLCPVASIDGGLALTGVRKLGLPALLRITYTSLRGSAIGELRLVRLWEDHDALELHADRPLPVQVDGDYVGEPTRLALRSVPDALSIIA